VRTQQHLHKQADSSAPRMSEFVLSGEAMLGFSTYLGSTNSVVEVQTQRSIIDVSE